MRIRRFESVSSPFVTLCAAALIFAACGGEDRPAGDTGTSDLGGDLSDVLLVDLDGGAPSVDVTGDWFLLRYDLQDAAGAVPGQPDVGETRFVQRGDTFTQYFGADDIEGIPGTIVDGVYVQTDGTFTARNTFPDSDHGAGTFEAGEFAMSFTFVRVGEPEYEVDGDWLADETEELSVLVAGDEVRLELGGALAEERDATVLTGRIALDTALLVLELAPEAGGLAAIVTWTSAEAGTLTTYRTSWTPDGAGHTDYAQETTTYALTRPAAVTGCTADRECEVTEECVERECLERVEGSTCAGDAACPGALYCARGLCQDGSTGDLCREDVDCVDPVELCDTECRPREAGEACGEGEACGDGLYCSDGTCWAGETGDPCSATSDCVEVTDACAGEPAVCTEVLVLIEPQPTYLGSSEGEPRRVPQTEPLRLVTLSRPFLIDPTETTRGAFAALMGYDTTPEDDTCGADCPIVRVSVFEAMAYANARSQAEGLPACYELLGCGDDGSPRLCSDAVPLTATRRASDCVGYRLPSSAEWELAARAGTSTATYAGDLTGEECDPSLDDIAWHCGNSGEALHPVGAKRPNAWGLYDMIGNAWEWTGSGPFYPFGIDVLDPEPPPSSYVVRGGSAWFTGRAAAQPAIDGHFAVFEIGFRLARTVPGAYGQPCDGDGSRGCSEGLYCAEGVCQDGRSGDFCGSPGVCQSGVCHEYPVGTEPSGAMPFGPPRCAPDGMVLVPGGEVGMGSPDTELGREASGLSETPFTASEPVFLWVAATEVTQGEWSALVGTNPSEFAACGDDCPVEGLSWMDAVTYANARSRAEGLTPCYRMSACSAMPGENPACGAAVLPVVRPGLFACDGYRLPSETEWELLARAGSETATYLGDLTAADCRDAIVGGGAWFCGNSGGVTHAVGSKRPNEFGLYDVLGNVSEWVGDWAGEYPSEYSGGWTGPATGTERVVRGGSYASTADRLRSASRESAPPGAPLPGAGLRLVREPTMGGAPCTPFVAETGCREGMTCVPTGRTLPGGVLGGHCVLNLADAPEPGELCDEANRCAAGSVCVTDLGYCSAFCDRDAPDGAAGACTSATAACTGLLSGAAACIESCEPFESFPSGGCSEGRWCLPSTLDDADGLCAAPLGSEPQGSECVASSECAPGHECYLGRCARYCDPAVNGTCGTGRECLALPAAAGSAELADFGRCVRTCDYDRDVACTQADELCVPRETTGAPEDVCGGIGSFWREGVPLEPGASCGDAGIPSGTLCGPVSACVPDCQPLCRTALAAPGEGYHPDCGELQYCAELGDTRFGICQRCEGGGTLLRVDFESGAEGVFGAASVRGWADGNYPNFADDEYTSGTDGDAGLALHTWLRDATGGWRQEFPLSSGPSRVTVSANFHLERDFDAEELTIGFQFYNDAGELILSTWTDLVGTAVPGDDPTDEDQWRRYHYDSNVIGAARAFAMIRFAGGSGVGTGLEGVRVDDIYVTSCD